MHFSALLPIAGLVTTAVAQVAVQQIYQFENSFANVNYVNIENVAVRSTNGQLLLNFVTGAIMAQLNPDNPQPEILVNITNAYEGAPGSLTGIAETCTDVYTVAAGNFVFGPQVPGFIDGVTGSFSIWNVDLRGKKAKAYKVTDIPEAGLLNGLSPISEGSETVLVADSKLGAIWKVNTKTGKYSQFLQNDILLPSPQNNFGANGLKVVDDVLHVTNSAQSFLAVAPLDKYGQLASPLTPVAYGPNGSAFDDLSVANGQAYIASQDGVYQVTRGNPTPRLLTSEIQGSTATALKGSTLYVVTGGEGGPNPVSGSVYSLQVGGSARKLARAFRG